MKFGVNFHTSVLNTLLRLIKMFIIYLEFNKINKTDVLTRFSLIFFFALLKYEMVYS